MFVVVLGAGLLFTFEYPPVLSVQTGFRGVALEQNFHPASVVALAAANKVPAPQDPADPDGAPASEVYQNVQVLGDLNENEFVRVMAAMTEWVSPEQGCTYCHAEGEELSADTLYTKKVARRMLQMTRDINVNWQPHVAATGVTCYTCHRGQPVPLTSGSTNRASRMQSARSATRPARTSRRCWRAWPRSPSTR